MTIRKIFGLSAALVTPFQADGSIDLARVSQHARHVLANGCDSVTIFGTTGEGASIARAERAGMLQALSGNAERFYAGICATSVADAVEQARQALDAGAEGLLLTPPFYFKSPDEEGIYRWLSQVIEGTGADARGVILYHIPGQTAVPLSIDLVGRMKTAFSGVVTGVKDSSGSWENTEALLAAHGDLSILVGDERQLAKAMAKGASGSICGVSNVEPALLRSLIHDGNNDPRLVPLVDLIVSYPVVPAVKALVAHIHGDEAFVGTRAPLIELTKAQRDVLIGGYDTIMGSDESRRRA